MLEELSLIPTSRFGALLSAQRREHSLELAGLSADSLGAFTVRDLQQIERGRRQLDDASAEKVAKLYGLDAGGIVPERKELIVDFDHQFIDTSGRTMNLGSGNTVEVLSRYLSLVYMMRHQDPGTELDFRTKDIDTLSVVLEISDDVIEQGLRELIDSHYEDLETRTEFFKRRLVIPGAGLLVAALSVGSLVFVGANETPAATGAREVAAMEVSETASVGRLAFAGEGVGTIGVQAEALISYDWQSLLPGWQIYYDTARPDLGALTNAETKTITLYVAEGASAAEVAGSLAHELGHAIDLEHFGDVERFRWLEARGLPAIWWPGDGLADYSVGSGDFAEAVSAMWVGSPSYSDFGDFSDNQLEIARDLLRGIR